MAPRIVKPPVVDASKVVATRKTPTRNPRAERARKVSQARTGTTIQMLKQAHSFALTAAAQALTGDAGEMAQPNSTTRTWQQSIQGYRRTVPELNAAMMYVGNCLSRVKIKIGRRNDDGTVDDAFDGAEPAQGLDPAMLAQAQDVLRSYRSPVGGQGELNRSYGELMFLVGELYLLPEQHPWGMTFDVLSTQELFKEGTGYIRYNGPGYENEPIDPGIIPIRIWRRDPQFSMLATSSAQSCLEILEELVILTRLVRSAAISRMALAGILAIADEFDAPLDEVGPDGDSAENTNPLLVDMINAGAKAIDDPASAAAYMPYLMQGPLELIQNGLKHIVFQTDDAVHVVKRREAIDRLAGGLDLPREAVVGYTETTFANAFQISEDTFNIHIEPTVKMLCDALTLFVLWPGLAVKLGLSPEKVKDAGYPDDILAFAVGYDASELVSRLDRTKDIIDVFTKDPTQMTVGIGEMRLTLGLSADGAPDDEEVAKRIDAVRLTKIREVIAAPASDAAQPIASAGDAPVPGESGGNAAIAETAAQAKAAAAATQQATVTASAMTNRIVGAAEASIERAVDDVGRKLRAKLNGSKSEDRTLIAGVTDAEVASRLGPVRVQRILGETYPIEAEMASFARTVARMLLADGHPHAGTVAATLTTAVGELAADRLYGPGSGLTVEATTQLLNV